MTATGRSVLKMEDHHERPLPSANATSGSAATLRIVLVHGFAQNRECWGPFSQGLVAPLHAPFPDTNEPDHPSATGNHSKANDHLVGHALPNVVIPLDVAGHGSEPADVGPFADEAERIGSEGGPAVYIGYSMGARLCLQLALLRPDLVHALVLIGGSPGVADPDERAQRAIADCRLADRIETIGLGAFLDEWLALPLFAGLDESMQCRIERLQNAAAGLAASLRLNGTGAQPNLWPSLPALHVPTLLLTGAFDAKFTVIASAMVAHMLTGIAHHVVIPGAGHSVHLEQPLLALDATRTFLESVFGW